MNLQDTRLGQEFLTITKDSLRKISKTLMEANELKKKELQLKAIELKMKEIELIEKRYIQGTFFSTDIEEILKEGDK